MRTVPGAGDDRTCPQCDSEFVTNSPSQRWCSARCRDLATGLDPDRERPPYDRTCVQCGTAFTTTTGRQTYCRPVCLRAHRKSRGLKGWMRILLGDPCTYCGEAAETVDHIEPRSRGGANDSSNLVAACRSCNSSKGTRPLLQFLLAAVLLVGLPATAVATPQALDQSSLKTAVQAVQLSDAGAKFIASFEGVRLTAYLDTLAEPDVWTVGAGHTRTARPGMHITYEQAMDLLQDDAAVAAGAVQRCIRVPLNQNQADGLISFAFNVGGGGLCTSTLARKLNAGCYRCVPAELDRWVYAGSRVWQGLVRRRTAEGDLFLAAVPKALRKLTEGQARHLQAAEKLGPDVRALRDFIRYFQAQIDRTKEASSRSGVTKESKAIYRKRVQVLRREKDQARAKIQRAENDQAAIQEGTLEALQPRAPPRADEKNKTRRDGLEETVEETPRVLAKAASYSNGRIPTSSLSRIFNGGGPTVYLAAAPAAAWNTMALLAAERADLATPQVNGSDSAYRTFDRQVYWRNYWCGRGQCGNAATPGSSNHGLAIAVDIPAGSQQLVRTIGNQFGWNHNCSDAPWEAWHHKWCGGFDRPDPGIDRANPVLRRGSGGPGQARWVRLAQRRLTKHGEEVDADGTYGLSTKKAVRRLQAEHKLKETGVITKPTWIVLRKEP